MRRCHMAGVNYLGGWWALSLTLGLKSEHALRIGLSSCQKLSMSLLTKHGLKSTSRKCLFRPTRSPLLKSNMYVVIFLI